MKIIKYISHFGDILAIPFFGLLIYYFYNINNRNIIENILLWFSLCGFIADIFFTYLFLKKIN